MAWPKYWRLIAIGLLLAAASAPARSADTTIGVGLSSCAAFGAAYKRSPQQAEFEYATWAFGFITGINAQLQVSGFKIRDVSSIPASEQVRAIRAYCDAHPLADFAVAVFDEFYRLKEAP